MTEEQKARRAEIARENGAKSKGPVSETGRFISSLNSITTGEHLEILKEELPECIALLSTDCRQAYIRLYQRHFRQYKPEGGCEQTLLRHMCVELFQLERTISLETHARQRGIDDVIRAYPNLSDADRELFAYEQGLQKDKLWRALQRDKKAHLAAYASYQRLFKQTRRDFRLIPPEPVNSEADNNLAEEPLPPPEVVAEAIAHADRAKNEPSYELPRWVAEMILNEELMAEIAPGYNVDELLEKLTAAPIPRAA
jgi:hypothetical protein